MVDLTQSLLGDFQALPNEQSVQILDWVWGLGGDIGVSLKEPLVPSTFHVVLVVKGLTSAIRVIQVTKCSYSLGFLLCLHFNPKTLF